MKDILGIFRESQNVLFEGERITFCGTAIALKFPY